MLSIESGKGTTHWMFDRWDEEQTEWVKQRSGLLAPKAGTFLALGVRPYSHTEKLGNVITTAGWTRMNDLLVNTGAHQAMDDTHTRIGAGNGTTAATAADTNLSAGAGSANRWFQVLDSAPTVSGAEITLVATFGTADGNFDWNEFGVDITDGSTPSSGATVGTVLFNHALSSQGTKASGQTWTATATLSFT